MTADRLLDRMRANGLATYTAMWLARRTMVSPSAVRRMLRILIAQGHVVAWVDGECHRYAVRVEDTVAVAAQRTIVGRGELHGYEDALHRHRAMAEAWHGR